MYFVDQSKIEQTLIYMEEILLEIKKQSFSSKIEKFGLERMVHVLIESILDVGNMMIDGFIMRDPGSYNDIIDILIDEKVLPAEEEEQGYKSVIGLRRMLVNDYTDINHSMLIEIMRDKEEMLGKFSQNIRIYLKNELGVANAFSNE
ncbi:DUF86 domain-containing protein [Oceanobacillus saliphilus]|uniref:DUF86 domain-containing protein n=1 Tax=Oceanobacillus saliphilus TaxID=2925834 RepID=UPI00201E1FBC|nr:DUF86 domain-containing protein [Oceanobacillus saliphilus]